MNGFCGLGNSNIWLRRLADARGAQLLEFALALPLLLVMLIGISDFGGAYNLKHVLTNAAREGARVTVSIPWTDNSASCVSAATPCQIQAAADAVRRYLINEGESAASCIGPSAPSGSGTETWTFACNAVSLTINRAFDVPGGPDGTVIPSTQVTLSYPYTWTFAQIIGLLVPGASPSLPTRISSAAVMPNLS